jgi:glycosyltransferase involved in cell wall biosynthesis
MIRVLQFADVINRFDFIDTLVHYADPAEFEMSVCVRTEEHNISAPDYGSETKYKLLPGNSRRDAFQTACKLSGILKDWKIDILHAHHFDQMVIGWLATKLYPATRLVLGRHYSDSIYRNQNKLKRSALLALERKINTQATRIIVPSRMIADILTNRQGVKPEKIDIVYYGFVPEKYAAVDPDAIRDLRREFDMDGRFVIGNFSRLHEEKGHRYLLEAIGAIKNEIPNLLALIVGEGTERQDLEAQITNLGLVNNVRLLGWRKDAMTIMSSVDAVVQSSLQEAFSQVVCETMWLCKPLLVTDVSGASDIIDNGVNGLIVKKGDADALARGIRSLASDGNLREQLGRNGRRFVMENLTIDKMIRYYEDSFRKAAASKRVD